jgi:hypothetical protein
MSVKETEHQDRESLNNLPGTLSSKYGMGRQAGLNVGQIQLFSNSFLINACLCYSVTASYPKEEEWMDGKGAKGGDIPSMYIVRRRGSAWVKRARTGN